MDVMAAGRRDVATHLDAGRSVSQGLPLALTAEATATFPSGHGPEPTFRAPGDTSCRRLPRMASACCLARGALPLTSNHPRPERSWAAQAAGWNVALGSYSLNSQG